MKPRLLAVLLGSLASLFTAVSAADFPWPGHGTLVLDAPAGWTFQARQAGDVAFSFRGTPDSKAAAIMQLTVILTPADHPVQPKEIEEQLAKMVQIYLPESVEKTFTARPFTLRQGYGWYGQFTDASLVGRPPQPDNFKIMRSGLLSLDEHCVAIASMQFDDPAVPEATTMLAIVGSLRLDRERIPPALKPTAQPDPVPAR